MIRHHLLTTSVLLSSAGLAQTPPHNPTAGVKPAQNAIAAAESHGLPKLAAPFLVMAGDEAITTNTGHAAPFATDLDGDGIWDLAVGEFGGGGCRIYKNHGTATEPKFASFTMLLSDGKPAAMESS